MRLKNKKLMIFFALIILILLFLFCNNQTKIENKFKIIKSSNIEKDGQVYDYQLIRLEGKNEPSYGVYYPNGNKSEAILIVEPYLKIDWSGGDVDSFHWNAVSINKNTESANLFLMNNFSVLIVFTRFYEGGNINNDVEDVIAGLEFLGNKSKRIGIWGASWGGFEALYASVNSLVKPIVGSIFYPPSDLESWVNWTYDVPDEFWIPYQERILDGSQGNYSDWNYDYIAKNLETDFLVIHAYEDTLVPFNQSYNLVEVSDMFNEMWLYKKKYELSHGEPLHEELLPFEQTVSGVYLMSGLTDREIVSAIDKKALQNYINELYVSEQQNQDINWSIILFETIFKPNIKYYDAKTFKIITSQELKLEFKDELNKIGIVMN